MMIVIVVSSDDNDVADDIGDNDDNSDICGYNTDIVFSFLIAPDHFWIW